MRCSENLDPPLFDLEDKDTIQRLQALVNFNISYTEIHRYLCVFVCTVGIILNSLHFFVLSRRPMRAYVINALLCAMAVCDAVTMTSYLIYILRFRFLDNDGTIGYPYPWLVFLLFHVTASIALHTGSLYLSVLMAYIRWTALDRLDAKWINHGAIRHIFITTAFAVTMISIPTLMVHKIITVNEALGSNETMFDGLYTVQLDETDINGCTLYKANLWITGILFKALPCGLLVWFTIALMWKLCEMSEKRKLLRGDGNNNRYRKKENISIDKTTLMLIIMLVVFLCTELPQGLLAVLSAMYPTHIGMMVYVHVGEVLDLLSLVNCLTSFVLYCAMSSTYRATVKTIFLRRTSSRKKSSIARRNTQAMQSLRLIVKSV